MFSNVYVSALPNDTCDGIVTVTGANRDRWTICDTLRMTRTATTSLYKRHRYPAEIISFTLCLYYRFSVYSA